MARARLDIRDLTHLAYRLGTSVRELNYLFAHIDQYVTRQELSIAI